MCDLLAAETASWKALILSLTPERLDERRLRFNAGQWNARHFICHMVQNSIYKHGQFSVLFFALGLDGNEPYVSPFPNEIYKSLHDTGGS